MAKTAKKAADTNPEKKTSATVEQRLARLEVLGDEIRRTDIPLDDALKAFEEGIKLARSLEKELEKVQNRIEILMSGTEAKAGDNPELELFDSGD